MSLKQFGTWLEDAAANAAGAGGVAGIGINPPGKPANFGEPGVENRKKKKKKTVVIKGLDEATSQIGYLDSYDAVHMAPVSGNSYGSTHRDVFPGLTVPPASRFRYDATKNVVIWDSMPSRQQYDTVTNQFPDARHRSLARVLGWIDREDLHEATTAEIEKAAKAIHDQWMASQKADGHNEHLSPDGTEDYMAPYHKLSDDAKDLDRRAVKAVLGALKEATAPTLNPDPDLDLILAKHMTALAQRRVKAGLDTQHLYTPWWTGMTEDQETFAGAPVFQVDMDRIMKVKHPKSRYHKYSRYVGTDEIGETIRQHGRKTRGDIVIQDSQTAVMTYLRRKAIPQ
jgi:hypothetical protein